jgi:hypothetical protein
VKLAYCYLRRVAWCLVNHQPHLTPPMNIAAKHPLGERRFPVTLSATSEALCMLYQRHIYEHMIQCHNVITTVLVLE